MKMKIADDMPVKIVLKPYDPAMIVHVRIAGSPATVPARFLSNGDGTWTLKIPKQIENDLEEEMRCQHRIPAPLP
jgi:hypothetical protein